MTRYLIDAHRFYADEEHYSDGLGLSYLITDFARISSAFASFQRDRKETYSVTVACCDTGAVLMHARPSPQDAEHSMNRAWTQRYRSRSAA